MPNPDEFPYLEIPRGSDDELAKKIKEKEKLLVEVTETLSAEEIREKNDLVNRLDKAKWLLIRAMLFLENAELEPHQEEKAAHLIDGMRIFLKEEE